MPYDRARVPHHRREGGDQFDFVTGGAQFVIKARRKTVL
jgi:hypothetical protein